MPCKDKTKTCKFPLKNNVLLVSPSPQIHEHKTANIAAVSLEIFRVEVEFRAGLCIG